MKVYSNIYNCEFNIIDTYLKPLGLKIEHVSTDDFYSIYLKDKGKKNRYLCYKKFFNQKGNIPSSFVDLMKKSTYRNMLFVERSPFRFNQFIDRQDHNKYCGSLLAPMSMFNSHTTDMTFNNYPYKVNKLVSLFELHWVAHNNDKNGTLANYKVPLIYFPLQKSTDKSITSVGGHPYRANDMVRTVFNIIKNIYTDFILVVKPHPSAYNKKRGFTYDYVPIKDKRVVFNKNANHFTHIREAQIVVSFNSSSLAEAILSNKKVLYFSNLPVVTPLGLGYRIPSVNYKEVGYIDDISFIINDYLNRPIDEKLRHRYIDFIVNYQSVYGGFHTLKEGSSIIKRRFNLK